MERNRRRNHSGFTLIELMIVIAIIAIIAAIAIPNLLMARMSGNEASTLGSFHTLKTVQEQYRQRFGVYATTFGVLENEGFIDNVLASGTKAGYEFLSFTAVDDSSWSVEAHPVDPGRTGVRYFYCDESGVIRFDRAAAADSSSSPIDG